MAATSRYKPGHVALERALSKLGLASRTQARALIEAGRVRVDGMVRKNPYFAVIPERAKLEIDGEPQAKAPARVFLLHKPRGVVTTRADERGRPTAFDLLKETGVHLIAVGRLDFATTGLLLFTNVTKLASWLTDPANQVPRDYVVTVRGRVDVPALQALRDGVEDAGERLRADAVSLLKASGRESHLKVTLCEGKNREVRRLFLAVGHEVTRLKRISFGALELGTLAPGAYREVSAEELTRAFPEAPQDVRADAPSPRPKRR